MLFEKNVHIKVDRDTLQIFMKCREKRCSQWRASTARCLTAGGLQRLWRPQILYLVGVSSHPFHVASYKLRSGTPGSAAARPAPFCFVADKKRWGIWSFAGKGVHLHRKTKRYILYNRQ